jgi:excisionase family DNA binding protein
MSTYCQPNDTPPQAASIDAIFSLLQALHERLDRAEPTITPEYLSIKQAAALTSLSQDHIRRAIKGGVLPVSDVGTADRPLYRVSRENVGKWMKEREAGPKPPLRKGRVKKSTPAPKPMPPSPHFPQSRRQSSPSTCSELSA